jgi:dienelactone hydrolase
MAKLAGLDTYLAKPKHSSSRAVLLIHDAFGLSQQNVKLVADQFARAGYLAVVPDFFHSDPLPMSAFSSEDKSILQNWFGKHAPGNARTSQDIDDVLNALKQQHGIEHVGCVGYCWGGWWAVHLASTDKVDAISVCHGSLLKPEDIQAIKKPAIFLCSEIDTQIDDQFRAQIERILSTKDFDTMVKLYPGTTHGFAVRGQMGSQGVKFSTKTDDPTTKAATDAINQSVSFFNKHTGKKSETALKSVGLAAAVAVVVALGVRLYQQRK